MEYSTLDKLGVRVSRLGFGCMRFPLTAEGKIDEPRAAAAGKSSAEAVRAASADSVKVWGLPDLGGGASGGTTVKALFTAYYPAANALEGGFLDALCIYGQVTNIRPEEIQKENG